MKNQQNTPQAATSYKISHFMASILFLFLITLNTSHLFSQNQQRKWFQNGKQADFTASPPTVSDIPPSGASYIIPGIQRATNGIHDHSNNRVLNINTNSISGPNVSSSWSIITGSGVRDLIGPEIVVFPAPGSCDSFYVFHSYQDLTNYPGLGYGEYYMQYHLVDRNVLNNVNDGVVGSGNIFYHPLGNTQPEFSPNVVAVSKEKPINGVKTRQVFYSEKSGSFYYIKKIDVTYAGISNPTTIFQHSDYLEISSYELELSPDGSKLALGRCRAQTSVLANDVITKDIIIYHLNNDGTLNTSLGVSGVTYVNIPGPTGVLERIIGLEFTPNGNRLFASNAGDKVYYVDGLNTSPTVTAISGTQDFTFSQMELVNNGGTDVIAVAKNEDEVFKIQGLINPLPSVSTFYNSKVPQHSNHVISVLSTPPYVTRNLLCLPDQIDGDNYTGSVGGWFDPKSSVSCCLNYYESQFDRDAQFSVPTGTSTWQTNLNPFNNAASEVVLERDLVIPSGAFITIKNMTFRFHPNARVVIQPNARLYLENATLTALDCDLTWKGVRVLGNPGQAHLVANQGYLNMTLNSTISHAQCGAAAYNLENGNFLQAGGIIQTNNANFINNLNDLDIREYTIANNSFFDLNTFKIDNDYRFSVANQPRALLNKVTGVKFRGCTFANDNTSLQTAALNNMNGVSLLDANATIELKNSAGNVFRNLNIGVWAVKFASNYTFTVKNSTFNNNQMGVYSGGVDLFTVTNNTFNVGTNNNFNSNTGVFINVGIGFTVRDNSFSGPVGSTPNVFTTPVSFGCVVKNICNNINGSCSDNAIFRNTFSRLCYANQSEGRNRANADTGPGLVYFCNTHSNNFLDIRILRDPALGATVNQGIRANQFTGNILGTAVSVQNTFSQNVATGLPNPWYDIWVNQDPQLGNIAYVRDASNSLTNPIQSPAPPNSPSVTITPGGTKGCMVNNPFLSAIGEQLTSNGFGDMSYEAAKESYLDAKYMYELLIDQGNTEELKSRINHEWDESAWELRTQLLNRSPNLSEEAILHAQSKNILPASLLFEVCMANKRSVTSPKVVEQLKSTLPQYMIDILLTANEPQTYRKQIEEQLVNYQGQMNDAYQSIARYVLSDSIDRSVLLENLLEDVPQASAKLQLVDFHLNKGNTTAANQALASYNTLVGNTSSVENTKLNTFMNFVISNYPQMNSLTEQDLQYVTSVASDSTHPNFVQAHAILRYYNQSDYLATPQNPIMPNFKKEVSPILEAIKSPSYLKIYPNPANQYLTVDYNLPLESGTVQVEIVDQTGKVVLANDATVSSNKGISNLVIADLPTGNYFVNIKHNNQQIASGSFVKSN